MTEPAPDIRILLVDDHMIVRDALAAMLSRCPGLGVVGAVAGDAAVRSFAALLPHVGLLDLRMPGTDGLDLLPAIARVSPATRVIMLSAHATAGERALARRRGAVGFVSKCTDCENLLAAIQTVAAGGFWFPADPALAAAWTAAELTERELEVLRQLGSGRSNEEIAAAIGVSPETIKSHLKNLFSKLGVANRAEAVSRGHQLELS